MRRAAFWVLAVFAPVLTGAGIYLLWRPTTLRVFGWLGQLGMDGPLRGARELALPFGQALPAWVLYSLPDGLWALALSAAMARIWRGRLGGPLGSPLGSPLGGLGAWAWVGAGLLIGVGGEGLQLLGWLPGTPDFMDALTSLVGAGVGVWVGLDPRGWTDPARDSEAAAPSLG
ncbi:MAG: hypothetical protein VX899_19635 [Myxococcota bacterium]|nr:hypothetical protein [Myxococcota bacterium]